MNFINQKTELIPQGYTIEDIRRHLEICNLPSNVVSEKLNEFKYFPIDVKYLSILEHATIYLTLYINHELKDDVFLKKSILSRYTSNQYSRVVIDDKCEKYYITTNLRVLYENNCLNDLQYSTGATQYHRKRVTVKVRSQINTSRIINSHRSHSITEITTNIFNDQKYSKSEGFAVVIPENVIPVNYDNYANTNNSKSSLISLCNDIAEEIDEDTFLSIDYWLFALLAAEFSYNNLIRLNWTPEEASEILPLGLNTELIHTAFIDQWEYFIQIRSNKESHPLLQELAHDIHYSLKSNNLI